MRTIYIFPTRPSRFDEAAIGEKRGFVEEERYRSRSAVSHWRSAIYTFYNKKNY